MKLPLPFFKISADASSPFISGILTSITTTFGINRATASMASLPFAASPTIFHSGRAFCTMARTPWRITSWSSTMKMVVATGALLVSGQRMAGAWL